MTTTVVRRLAVPALAWLALFAAPALATNVNFTGQVSYSFTNTMADLEADSVSNNTGASSNALRLEFWAFAAPYSGGASGYRLAVYPFGTIGASTQELHVEGDVPLTGPPAGTYYLSMLLTEYTGAATDDGYTVRDHADFMPPEVFGTPSSPVGISPQPGLWWNPSESGSGYAFDFKHGVLVVTVYSYKADGTPLWYIASGPVTGNTFSGTLNRTTGGQCISCAYVTPVISGNDGTMTIQFSSSTSGTMYLPGGRVIPVIPQAF